MSNMFSRSKFNGDISKWNVSSVRYMGYMFYNSKFSGDISLWDTSKVECNSGVFDNCVIKEEYRAKFRNQ